MPATRAVGVRRHPSAPALHAVAGEAPVWRFYEMLGGEAQARLREWGSIRSYPAGSAIFHRRELADSVLVVLSGRVKIVSYSEGREVLLQICAPGDLLGELSALEHRAHEATAMAIDQVQCLVILAAAFSAFLAERPEAAMLLVRVLARRLADSERRRVQFATQDTLGRLACLLLELCERFGGEAAAGTRIDLPISQEELAGCIGASHRAVSGALQTLRKLGCVETGRRAITVLDLAALREVGS